MPSKLLTPELISAYSENIAKGVPQKDSARQIGISPNTLKTWLTRGRRWDEDNHDVPETELLYVALREAHDQAESQHVVTLVDGMNSELSRGRTTANIYLERLARFRPDTYGRKDKIEHEHSVTWVVERPPRGEWEIEGKSTRGELPAAASADGVSELEGEDPGLRRGDGGRQE